MWNPVSEVCFWKCTKGPFTQGPIPSWCFLVIREIRDAIIHTCIEIKPVYGEKLYLFGLCIEPSCWHLQLKLIVWKHKEFVKVSYELVILMVPFERIHPTLPHNKFFSRVLQVLVPCFVTINLRILFRDVLSTPVISKPNATKFAVSSCDFIS